MSWCSLPRTAGTVILLIPFAAGCGRVDSSVSGQVTLDGQPLPSGSITFFPADGKGPVAGGAVADGKYTVKGLATGPKVVTVEAGLPAPTGPISSGDVYEKGAKPAPPPPVIPANAPGNGQKYEVVAGVQTLDVAITKSGGAKR